MHSLLAALALTLGAVACTEDQSVSSITLDKDQLQLKAEETYQLIATVEPASMSNVELTWESSDTEVAVVDQSGVVTAVAEGTAEIKVSYGQASDVCTVTVGSEFSMTLSVLDMTSSMIKIEANPSDMEATYYVSMMTKADYDAAGTPEAIIEKTAKELEKAAEAEGMNVKDYLNSVLRKGIAEVQFDNLDDDTEYVAFGFALDADMVAGETVFTCDARTNELEALDFTIEISDIKYDGFNALVTPSANDVKYFQSCVTKETYDYYGGTDEALIEQFKEVFIANAGFAQMTIEEYMNTMLVVGKQNVNVIKLLPSTDYYFVAIQFDESANHFNKMTKEAVKTIEQEYIDFTSEINVDEVTQSSVKVSTTVNIADQRYCIEALTKTALDRFGDNIEESVINWWYFRTENARNMDTPEHPLDQFIVDITLVGNQSGVTKSDLESDQDYVVFAFAVDKYGIPISNVSYKDFHTEGRQYAIDMTFEVEYSYSDPYITASIVPSNSKQPYYFDIILAENIQSIVDQPELVINWATSHPFFKKRIVTGNTDYTAVLRNDKAYAVGFAYNEATGDVSEPYIKELDPADFK